MKLPHCEEEIKDRHYLIGAEMEHHSGIHKIKIDSLEACPITGTDIYYIRCHYYKQDDTGTYGNILLVNNLNDILGQYLAY